MIALIDESIMSTGNGVYVLACVVVPSHRRDRVGRAIRKIHNPRRRFHWKDEERRERMAMTRLIANHAAHTFACLESPAPRARHEVIRRHMLSILMRDLAGTTTTELVVESRQASNDAHDRAVIASLVRRNASLAHLTYDHAMPTSQQLLGLADGLAGAVMAGTRGSREYVALLATNGLVIHPVKRRDPRVRLMRP